MSKYVHIFDYFLVLHHKCFQKCSNPDYFFKSRCVSFSQPSLDLPEKLKTIRLETEEGSRVKTLQRHIVSEHFCVSESQRCSSFFFIYWH